MAHEKLKSAFLKLDNASEHIQKVNKILKEDRPFTYVLETDIQTSRRATFAKRDEAVIDKLALACGDAAHNLRSALDHAYSQIVLPFATTAGEKKAVQFPFCAGPQSLTEAVKNRLAHRVSQTFFDAIIALKPHGEPGGNKLLYLIEKMDIPDKHTDLTPMADYKTLSQEILRRQIPDFPKGVNNLGFGGFRRDISWPFTSVDMDSVGRIVPPTTCVFEKELDVPVEIVFQIAAAKYQGPVIPTLNQILDVTKGVLTILERFA
jgi:hypothetical protein